MKRRGFLALFIAGLSGMFQPFQSFTSAALALPKRQAVLNRNEEGLYTDTVIQAECIFVQSGFPFRAVFTNARVEFFVFLQDVPLQAQLLCLAEVPGVCTVPSALQVTNDELSLPAWGASPGWSVGARQTIPVGTLQIPGFPLRVREYAFTPPGPAPLAEEYTFNTLYVLGESAVCHGLPMTRRVTGEVLPAILSADDYTQAVYEAGNEIDIGGIRYRVVGLYRVAT